MMKIRRTTYGIGGYDPDAPDKNIVEDRFDISPGLSADPETIPADGVTVATCHFAREEPGTVTWDVNGTTTVELLIVHIETGLWTSEIEVVASQPGPISVDVDGENLTIQAV